MFQLSKVKLMDSKQIFNIFDDLNYEADLSLSNKTLTVFSQKSARFITLIKAKYPSVEMKYMSTVTTPSIIFTLNNQNKKQNAPGVKLCELSIVWCTDEFHITMRINDKLILTNKKTENKAMVFATEEEIFEKIQEQGIGKNKPIAKPTGNVWSGAQQTKKVLGL